MKIINKLKELWRKISNTKRIILDYKYEIKDCNAELTYNSELKALEVYLEHLVLIVPLDVDLNEVEKSGTMPIILAASLDLSSVDELKEMLKTYEEEEDYQMCAEIQTIIDSKLKENEKGKRSSL